MAYTLARRGVGDPDTEQKIEELIAVMRAEIGDVVIEPGAFEEARPGESQSLQGALGELRRYELVPVLIRQAIGGTWTPASIPDPD